MSMFCECTCYLIVFILCGLDCSTWLLKLSSVYTSVNIGLILSYVILSFSTSISVFRLIGNVN